MSKEYSSYGLVLGDRDHTTMQQDKLLDYFRASGISKHKSNTFVVAVTFLAVEMSDLVGNYVMTEFGFRSGGTQDQYAKKISSR